MQDKEENNFNTNIKTEVLNITEVLSRTEVITRTEVNSSEELLNQSEENIRKKDEKKEGIVWIGKGTILIGQNDKFTLLDVISDSTGEADIYLCNNSKNEKCVAKIYRGGISNKHREKVIDFFSQNSNSGIIKLLDYGLVGKKVFDIYPYYIHGDLTKHINNIKSNWDFIENIFIPTVNEALNIIHKNGMIHRDIKPGNFFFSNDKTNVILGDFGIATEKGENVSLAVTQAKFTRGYAAPEVYGSLAVKDKVDYYALGITLATLCAGEEIFKDKTQEEIQIATCYGNIPYPNINEKFNCLIQALTRIDTNDRAGYKEVSYWIKNKKIEVKPNKQIIVEHRQHDANYFEKPYHLIVNGKPIYTRQDLSAAIIDNWSLGIQHLKRTNLFSEFFRSVNQAIFLSIAAILEDERIANKESASLFSFIYVLDPTQTLAWKGKRYTTLKELVLDVEDKFNNNQAHYFDELIDSNALSNLLKLRNENSDMIGQIENIENRAKKNIKISVLRLIYEMLPEKKGLIFKEHKFTDLIELINYIISNAKTTLFSATNFLYKNDEFYAWLEVEGYGELVEALLKCNDLNSEDIIERLLFVMKKIYNNDDEFNRKLKKYNKKIEKEKIQKEKEKREEVINSINKPDNEIDNQVYYEEDNNIQTKTKENRFDVSIVYKGLLGMLFKSIFMAIGIEFLLLAIYAGFESSGYKLPFYNDIINVYYSKQALEIRTPLTFFILFMPVYSGTVIMRVILRIKNAFIEKGSGKIAFFLMIIITIYGIYILDKNYGSPVYFFDTLISNKMNYSSIKASSNEEKLYNTAIKSWQSIEASTYISDTKVNYSPQMVNDNNKATSWQVRTEKNGISQWIILKNDVPSTLTQMSIINGNAESQEKYYANNRVKKINIEFSDGSSIIKSLNDNTPDFQTINFGKKINSTFVKITIFEVYNGKTFQDTCISEIKLF